jgi:hypothetical protein
MAFEHLSHSSTILLDEDHKQRFSTSSLAGNTYHCTDIDQQTRVLPPFRLQIDMIEQQPAASAAKPVIKPALSRKPTRQEIQSAMIRVASLLRQPGPERNINFAYTLFARDLSGMVYLKMHNDALSIHLFWGLYRLAKGLSNVKYVNLPGIS